MSKLEPGDLCPGKGDTTIRQCGCRGFLPELNRVMRALEGQQFTSALDQINALLKKHGNKSCLLSGKLKSQLHQQKLDEAEATAKVWVETNPDNGMAWTQYALLDAAQRRYADALDKLQTGFERNEAQAAGPVFLETILAIMQLMPQDGNVLTPWLWSTLLASVMASSTEDDDDSRRALLSMRRQLDEMAGAGSLLLNGLLQRIPMGGHDDPVSQALRSGRYRQARDRINALPPEQRNGESLVQLAICGVALADLTAARDALRELASRDDTPWDEALECEALAQKVEAADQPGVPRVLVQYSVDDIDKLMESVLSNKRFSRIPVDPATLQSREGPPPKALFFLLDRDPPASSEDLKREDVPFMLADLMLFGRQTDRPAHLDVMLYRDEQFENTVATLEEILNGLVGEKTEEPAGESPVTDQVMSWRWQFPAGTSPEAQARLMQEQRQWTIDHKWPQQPNPLFQNQTPEAAAASDAGRLPVAAALLTLELEAERRGQVIEFDRVKRKLGLPGVEPIDPWKNEQAVQETPPARMHRLDLVKLNLEDLLTAFQRAIGFGLRGSIHRLGDALLETDLGVGEKATVCRLMAENCESSAETLTYLHRGIELLRNAQISPAPLLLMELNVYLDVGDGPAAQHVLNEIMSRHQNEPNVAAGVAQLLTAYGLIDPRQLAGSARPGAAPGAPAAPGGGLWTPGQPPGAAAPPPTTPPAAAEQESKSKLWLPGMD